jgi:tetratricopeptide (TPR) repeat protein
MPQWRFYKVAPKTRALRRAATIGAIATVAAGVAGWLYFASRAQALTEKDTVVLSDFTNTTADAIFDDTLKTGLNVSLRQSPFLNVLADSQVAKTLQQMTRPAGTKLTPEVARELCQRTGSKAYIAGAIGSLGSEYVVELKAVNFRSGDTLAEEQVTAASKEKVLDALGEAATKLRGELGESLTTVEKLDVPLAQATTPSLEALQAYTLGLRASNEKGYAAALPYHQRAIQLDPNFAMGYRAAGADYNSLGETGRASESFTKAFQLRERASEREKLSITSDYYRNITGELEKSAQTTEELIESYPRSAGAHADLGIVFAQQGHYERAVDVTRQASHLAPGSAIPLREPRELHRCLAAVRRSAADDPRGSRARKPDGFILPRCSLRAGLSWRRLRRDGWNSNDGLRAGPKRTSDCRSRLTRRRMRGILVRRGN